MKKLNVQNSRKFKLSCLIALTSAFALLAQAQLTQPPSSGLTFWINGDTVSHSGATVTGWDNQVSNPTATSVSPTGLTAPTWTDNALNSHDIVTFDGTSQTLSQANVNNFDLAGATDSSIFLVIRPQGTAGSDRVPFADWSFSGHDQRLFAWSDTSSLSAPAQQIRFEHGDPSQGDTLDKPISDVQSPAWYGNWHVVSMTRSGNNATIQVDSGTPTTSSTFVTPAQQFNDSTLYVGGLSGGFYFQGDIAEILVYNTGDANNATDVQGYLENKYFSNVPEPSQYATVFGLACIGGALMLRRRRQAALV